MHIGWIGLGKCGLPIAEHIAQKSNTIGGTLLGFDKVAKDTPVYTSQLSDLMTSEIIFILVETPHLDPTLDGSVPVTEDRFADFDYSALRSALRQLSEQAYTGVVVVSSTVSPGTMRGIAEEFSDLRIVYMPVMIHIGTVANDFVSAPVYFIGSQDPHDGEIVEQCIRNFVDGKIRQGTYEEVELYKMFGNIFTSLKIGFVNTISEMIEAGDLNASSWNVMEALLDEKQNFNTERYLMPGSGNGGPCHPRDGVVLSWLSNQFKMESRLLNNITQVRQDQALALAKHLVSYGLPIVILGKSFKMGVDLTVGSYSVLVGEYCKQLGAEVQYDTSVDHPAVVLIAHPNQKMLETYPPAAGSQIVDLWNLGIPGSKTWGNRLR